MSADLAVNGLVDEDDRPVNDWPTIRAFVLERDKYRCRICFLRPATDVDHIWPRRLGGDDHVENLRAACGRCNKAKGDRVDVAAASSAELVLAADALGQRALELEHERDIFERELILRALVDGHLIAQARTYRLVLGIRRDGLNWQINEWDRAIERFERDEKRHAGQEQEIAQ